MVVYPRIVQGLGLGQEKGGGKGHADLCAFSHRHDAPAPKPCGNYFPSSWTMVGLAALSLPDNPERVDIHAEDTAGYSTLYY
jgi:hypothetical protein